MHIRCGLAPTQAALIRVCLGLDQHLVQLGVRDELAANRQMLKLLLDTANDPALPWYWRSVCLEHVSRPLARLAHRLALHDPLALQALQGSVQQTRDGLPPTPRPATA